MQKDELLKLAEWVETLSGPDRETDNAIARELGWTEHTDEDDPVYNGQITTWWAEPGQDWSTCTVVPRYTASLDAAMTLVPGNYLTIVKELWNADLVTTSGYAIINRYEQDGEKKRWNGDFHAACATPALALCAAALRAAALRALAGGE